MATSTYSGFCKYLSKFFSIVSFLVHLIFKDFLGVTLNAFKDTPLVDGLLTYIREACVFKVSPEESIMTWQPSHSFELMVQHACFGYSIGQSRSMIMTLLHFLLSWWLSPNFQLFWHLQSHDCWCKSLVTRFCFTQNPLLFSDIHVLQWQCLFIHLI